MSKRGRPRKSGPRKPSGGLRFVPDAGTAELAAHRAAGVGCQADQIDTSDPRLSYPLGILFVQRRINGPQHYAGRRYLGLFVRAVRGVGIPSVLGNMVSSGATIGPKVQEYADDEAKIRSQYLDAREALDAIGGKAAATVDNVAIHEVRALGSNNLIWLVKGLNGLHAHFLAHDDAELALNPGMAQQACGGCLRPFNRFTERTVSLLVMADPVDICTECATLERRLIVLAKTRDIPEQAQTYRRRLGVGL